MHALHGNSAAALVAGDLAEEAFEDFLMLDLAVAVDGLYQSMQVFVLWRSDDGSAAADPRRASHICL